MAKPKGRSVASKGGWDYRIERPGKSSAASEAERDSALARQLAAIGAEGWELCALTGPGQLVFKRPA